jgi:menaquinone-9 beta-reductase
LQQETIYDVVIIGGGLAGLSLAIQLRRHPYKVLVLEKEQYPFHRVCGEYISFESWDFLESLGYPLSEMNLPVINHFIVTAPNGLKVEQLLPQGGFGISRYKIDNELAQLARQAGALVVEGVKATDVVLVSNINHIQTNQGLYKAKLVVGCFGKRSNMDVKWKRSFINNKATRLNNYIGVKYHVKTNQPQNAIALHNFKDGYCGVSKVEGDEYCICYLTTAANLQAFGGSFKAMEENLLYQNPHLKELFTQSAFLWKEPITIAQISFQKKEMVYNNMLMLGDAAGMIAPLCGNGMSIALHGSKIAAGLLHQYLQKKITYNQLLYQYQQQWQQLFSRRLWVGRFIQRIFGKPFLTSIFLRLLKPFPPIISFLIRQTHGKPF